MYVADQWIVSLNILECALSIIVSLLLHRRCATTGPHVNTVVHQPDNRRQLLDVECIFRLLITTRYIHCMDFDSIVHNFMCVHPIDWDVSMLVLCCLSLDSCWSTGKYVLDVQAHVLFNFLLLQNFLYYSHSPGGNSASGSYSVSASNVDL